MAQAPAEGCAGSVFTYTVAISNTGGAATTQPFTLTALLDPRAAYVPGSASNGGTWAGDRVSWRITEGLLPDGQEAIARSFAVQTDQSLLDNLDVLTHTYALHSLEVTPDGAAEGTTTVHKVWADFAHDAPKCVDSPVTFNYEMPQPPLANVTLDWTFGGGPSGSGAAQPTVQATFPVAGIYTVTVNAAGTCGIGPAAIDQTDSFTDVISIEGVEAQIAAGPAPACVGQDVGFWAIGPVTGTIAGYLWDFGDGVTSTLPSPAHPYAGAGDYTAALTITTAGGCVDTAVLPISVQSAAAAFEVFDDPSCMNETMAFSSTTTIQGSGPVSYTWAFGDGVVEDDADGQAQHAYAAPGLYTAALTVTTVAGCTDTATRHRRDSGRRRDAGAVRDGAVRAGRERLVHADRRPDAGPAGQLYLGLRGRFRPVGDGRPGLAHLHPRGRVPCGDHRRDGGRLPRHRYRRCRRQSGRDCRRRDAAHGLRRGADLLRPRVDRRGAVPVELRGRHDQPPEPHHAYLLDRGLGDRDADRDERHRLQRRRRAPGVRRAGRGGVRRPGLRLRRKHAVVHADRDERVAPSARPTAGPSARARPS